MAAPEPSHGPEVQQTSVQNRPIFFARSRSSLVLKPLTVFAITESLSSIFKCRWTVDWVKIGDFREITGYISKTVQDRRMVSIKVEWEVVWALSNGEIAADPE